MIVNIHTIPVEQIFDICIAGSGPAGMTLALELARRGKTVLLLEGGDAEFSNDWQSLYIGENAGDAYYDLDATRVRQLGGSSNHWAGWCRPLDSIDFEYKDYSHEAHWPISRSDLDPYLESALTILDAPSIFEDRYLNDSLMQFCFSGSHPITRFCEKYTSTIDKSANIILALQCSLVGLELSGSRVASFRVRDLGGVYRQVRAEIFVLACGGIENSRLLLCFNEATQNRLIANSYALGRYWMDHPTFTVGEVVHASEEDSGREFFCLTPERMREAGVLNCGLRLEWTRRREGLRKVVHDLGCVAPKLGQWLYRRVDKRLVCVGTLRAAWEQEPNPESRITLSTNRRDAFGMPLAVLDWRKTPRDIATARATAIELGAYFARTDRGRMMLHDWVLQGGPWPENDELCGFHHIGGTRMSDVPERGVVNSDLRLWNQENMYIAGSSVFPSGGHANPTLTIVQLSLRLADHLS